MHLTSSRRIMIIGNSGAGKSTLAHWLHDKLQIPLIHLDQEFWQPGWTQTSDEVWKEKINQLASRDTWIMDGNYRSSVEHRAKEAHSVIFLDLPTWICVVRVLKRVIIHFNHTRADMALDCPERFDFKFLHYILTFNRFFKPAILGVLEKYGAEKHIYHITSAREVETFKKEVDQSLAKMRNAPST